MYPRANFRRKPASKASISGKTLRFYREGNACFTEIILMQVTFNLTLLSPLPKELKNIKEVESQVRATFARYPNMTDLQGARIIPNKTFIGSKLHLCVTLGLIVTDFRQ